MHDELLAVEFIDNPCLPDKGFSEVVVAQFAKLFNTCAKERIGGDAPDGVFEFLIHLTPNQVAKLLPDPFLDFTKISRGAIKDDRRYQFHFG